MNAVLRSGLRQAGEWVSSTRLRRSVRSAARVGEIRVLTYHGICRSGEERLAWMPHYFISDALLDRHLAWIRSVGDIVTLGDVHELLQGRAPGRERLFAVTFDDGYFNNLSLAAPVLSAHRAPATVFLSTGLMAGGGEVPIWIQARILQHRLATGELSDPDGIHRATVEQWLRLGLRAPSDLVSQLQALWHTVCGSLDETLLDSVRCMTAEEARQLRECGIELGAHTVSHPILSCVSGERRRRELIDSVEAVRALTGGRRVPDFAYPNGKLQDFDDSDVETLRVLGVPLAFTTIQGGNFPGAGLDLHRLRRLAVSKRRTRQSFLAALSGFYDQHRFWYRLDD